MAGRLAGKRCFVTAAGQGIGRASALAMPRRAPASRHRHRRGQARRPRGAGIETRAPRRARRRRGRRRDRRGRPARRALQLRRLRPPGHRSSTAPTTDWDFAFDAQRPRDVPEIRASLPAMLSEGGGSIVNMSSAASSSRACRTVRLRRQQGGGDRPDQVGRGRLRHPGHPLQLRSAPARSTRRASAQRIAAQCGGRRRADEAARKAFVARQPMGRLGTAEEMAALVVYLASDESAFATGRRMVDRRRLDAVDPIAGRRTMKLLRYGRRARKSRACSMPPAHPRLSGVVADIGRGDALAGRAGEAARARPGLAAARCPASPRIGPPSRGTKKFICIGLNYADHAAETGAPVPKEPIVFMKSLSALSGPNDDVIIPQRLDEDRLGGRALHRHRQARRNTSPRPMRWTMSPATASCNDVSEREYQIERGGAWDKGKGCDTFGPIGPWLVTSDEVADPQNLTMWLEVDGERSERHHPDDDLRRASSSQLLSASS